MDLVSNFGVFAFIIVSHLLFVMARLLQVISLLSSFAIAFAIPNRKVPYKERTFSLQTNRKGPLGSNATSQLGRRNASDAVSMHVDPSHVSAWSPIQLGGSYFRLDSFISHS